MLKEAFQTYLVFPISDLEIIFPTTPLKLWLALVILCFRELITNSQLFVRGDEEMFFVPTNW